MGNRRDKQIEGLVDRYMRERREKQFREHGKPSEFLSRPDVDGLFTQIDEGERGPRTEEERNQYIFGVTVGICASSLVWVLILLTY